MCDLIGIFSYWSQTATSQERYRKQRMFDNLHVNREYTSSRMQTPQASISAHQIIPRSNKRTYIEILAAYYDIGANVIINY